MRRARPDVERLPHVMTVYLSLAACAASLPEWSRNSPLRHAEEPVHHRDGAGHVELPASLQWRTRPVASAEVVACMMAVASLCMMMCACWALIAARRSLGEGGGADGKMVTTPDTSETLPLRPTPGFSARERRISRELFAEPESAHAVSIADEYASPPPFRGHRRSASV